MAGGLRQAGSSVPVLVLIAVGLWLVLQMPWAASWAQPGPKCLEKKGIKPTLHQRVENTFLAAAAASPTGVGVLGTLARSRGAPGQSWQGGSLI